MNKDIFSIKPLYKKGWLQRIFNQERDENCVLEINNILASTPVLSISKGEIDRVIEKYGWNVFNEFSLNFEEFYITYMSECCKNGIMSDRESSELKHLKEVLRISDEKDIHYRERIAPAIATDVYVKLIQTDMTEDKRLAFQKLVTFLHLDAEALADIKKSKDRQYIDHLIEPFRASKRMVPNELYVLEKNLNHKDIELPKGIKQELKRYEKYWQLENRELTTCTTNIDILKSEVCLLEEDNIAWHELRSERGRSTYRFIKKGTLTMTNKRIYFTSHGSTSKLTYAQISNIRELDKTVLIEKYKGKEPKLVTRKDVVAMAIVMKRIWSTYRN